MKHYNYETDENHGDPMTPPPSPANSLKRKKSPCHFESTAYNILTPLDVMDPEGIFTEKIVV